MSKKATKQFPNSSHIHYLLGNSLGKAGKLKVSTFQPRSQGIFRFLIEMENESEKKPREQSLVCATLSIVV